MSEYRINKGAGDRAEQKQVSGYVPLYVLGELPVVNDKGVEIGKKPRLISSHSPSSMESKGAKPATLDDLRKSGVKDEAISIYTPPKSEPVAPQGTYAPLKTAEKKAG